MALHLYDLDLTSAHAATASSYSANTWMVVIAATPKQARELAAKRASAEGPDSWLDGKKSTCRRVALRKARVLFSNGDG